MARGQRAGREASLTPSFLSIDLLTWHLVSSHVMLITLRIINYVPPNSGAQYLIHISKFLFPGSVGKGLGRAGGGCFQTRSQGGTTLSFRLFSAYVATVLVAMRELLACLSHLLDCQQLA